MSLLEVGETFAGCRVEASENKDNCHVWIFSRDGHAVVISLPYDQYFSMIVSPMEREELLDRMAAQIYEAMKGKERKLFFDQGSN